MHKRSRDTVLVPVKNIVGDKDFQYDPRQLHLVKLNLLGKINVGLTRLRTDDIVSGFYKRVDGSNIHFTNLKSRHINTFIKNIKWGSRPFVEVYWNNLAPNGGSYVCADDEPVLAAYVQLKILKIPVRILRPKKIPESEGSVWIEARDELVALSQTIPPKEQDGYPAYKEAQNLSSPEGFNFLVKRCVFAQESVSKFHEDGGIYIHYHQMLHAILRRHARLLSSISMLIEAGRLEHAYLLSRTAYEAFLNFYLDWLAPEFFGPRLQFLSAIRMQNRGNSKDEMQLGALCNFTTFFENTSEKARMSVLGTRFHEAIYPAMSRVAHQSYAYLEREASAFADEVDDADSVERLRLCLNVITRALVSRVLNDIGVVEG